MGNPFLVELLQTGLQVVGQRRGMVEIAGMLPYCDFVEQQSFKMEERQLRPDLIVRLPGDKKVVVDAGVISGESEPYIVLEGGEQKQLAASD